jgi:hypothetical protein
MITETVLQGGELSFLYGGLSAFVGLLLLFLVQRLGLEFCFAVDTQQYGNESQDLGCGQIVTC